MEWILYVGCFFFVLFGGGHAVEKGHESIEVRVYEGFVFGSGAGLISMLFNLFGSIVWFGVIETYTRIFN